MEAVKVSVFLHLHIILRAVFFSKSVVDGSCCVQFCCHPLKVAPRGATATMKKLVNSCTVINATSFLDIAVTATQFNLPGWGVGTDPARPSIVKRLFRSCSWPKRIQFQLGQVAWVSFSLSISLSSLALCCSNSAIHQIYQGKMMCIEGRVYSGT